MGVYSLSKIRNYCYCHDNENDRYYYSYLYSSYYYNFCVTFIYIVYIILLLFQPFKLINTVLVNCTDRHVHKRWTESIKLYLFLLATGEMNVKPQTVFKPKIVLFHNGSIRNVIGSFGCIFLSYLTRCMYRFIIPNTRLHL